MPTGDSPVYVAAGQLGGDGIRDLVVATRGGNETPAGYQIARRSRGAPSGDKPTYDVNGDAIASPASVGAPLACALGDLDGNSSPELITIQTGSPAIYVAPGSRARRA